jgi:hypothetical protein
MLTSPLTVLSIRYPPVVYVNSPLTVLSIIYPPVVIDGHLMFKTFRGAININYRWISYA